MKSRVIRPGFETVSQQQAALSMLNKDLTGFMQGSANRLIITLTIVILSPTFRSFNDSF